MASIKGIIKPKIHRNIHMNHQDLCTFKRCWCLHSFNPLWCEVWELEVWYKIPLDSKTRHFILHITKCTNHSQKTNRSRKLHFNLVILYNLKCLWSVLQQIHPLFLKNHLQKLSTDNRGWSKMTRVPNIGGASAKGNWCPILIWLGYEGRRYFSNW